VFYEHTLNKVAGHQLAVNSKRIKTVLCRMSALKSLPTANCQLPTANCQLPTAK